LVIFVSLPQAQRQSGVYVCVYIEGFVIFSEGGQTGSPFNLCGHKDRLYG